MMYALPCCRIMRSSPLAMYTCQVVNVAPVCMPVRTLRNPYVPGPRCSERWQRLRCRSQHAET
jgi:hypothetical protein